MQDIENKLTDLIGKTDNEKQFEYRPFDRVTVKAFKKEMRAIFLCKQESRTGSYYVCAFGDGGSRVEGIGALPDEIRPGHYDDAGNWTPAPGDPCYLLEKDGHCVNGHITEITDKGVCVKLSDTPVYFCFEVIGGFAIHQHNPLNPNGFTMKIYPGRIKTAE